MIKPILVDDLVATDMQVSVQVIEPDTGNSSWWIARALNWRYGPIDRIVLAWEVFRGRAIAVRFKEDEQIK